MEGFSFRCTRCSRPPMPQRQAPSARSGGSRRSGSKSRQREEFAKPRSQTSAQEEAEILATYEGKLDGRWVARASTRERLRSASDRVVSNRRCGRGGIAGSSASLVARARAGRKERARRAHRGPRGARGVGWGDAARWESAPLSIFASFARFGQRLAWARRRLAVEDVVPARVAASSGSSAVVLLIAIIFGKVCNGGALLADSALRVPRAPSAHMATSQWQLCVLRSRVTSLPRAHATPLRKRTRSESLWSLALVACGGLVGSRCVLVARECACPTFRPAMQVCSLLQHRCRFSGRRSIGPCIHSSGCQ